MSYTPRTTKPGKGNKYYITKSKGGYSNCIEGYNGSTKKCDPDLNVLPNCVGYAVGRFNEIGGYGSCKYLTSARGNAETFIAKRAKADGLTVGQTPKVGSVMVWQKGPTQNESDGAGHVAIVEKVIDANIVETSESGYGAKTSFTYRTRKKSDGVWGKDAKSYKFLGFIYHPKVLAEEKAAAEAKKKAEEEAKKKAEASKNTSTPKVGDKYTLKCDVKGYNTAANALNGKDPKATYKKGDYYIYKISGKSYNITKKKGVAGAWIDPAKNK